MTFYGKKKMTYMVILSGLARTTNKMTFKKLIFKIVQQCVRVELDNQKHLKPQGWNYTSKWLTCRILFDPLKIFLFKCLTF